MEKHATYFCQERHDPHYVDDSHKHKTVKWRMKERMKTVNAGLVLCLKIGYDPPDLIKINPCAKLECWIDPHKLASDKSLELIGQTLEAQYQHWQDKTKIKQCLDPTLDEVKKLCLTMRRTARDDRILFHYNGHGVPRPTNNGEIWVFDPGHTQYIPLSIYQLQAWMASPSVYVFDCSGAGLAVQWFFNFLDQRDKHAEQQAAVPNAPPQPRTSPLRESIMLASCGANELLPMNPAYPADMFTSCLTTPIKMALRWFRKSSILTGFTNEMVDRTPGELHLKRTPLGELNWIFTAVTDSIAWDMLPRDVFHRLFRQDQLVASLFRNFLLAERIMHAVGVNPVSVPKLPQTYMHPMWESWDLAVEACLSQLPALLADPNTEYIASSFWSDQLTAFEMWISVGTENKPPKQLPIILQVLLNPSHRLRALQLLGQFLDLGPWAVNLALSVGIFPCFQRLLLTADPNDGDGREILIFIWAKILSFDRTCQIDVVKDGGYKYFVGILSARSVTTAQRVTSGFVLSAIMQHCRPGQSACLSMNLLGICLNLISDPDPRMRTWMTLCLAKLWENFEDGKWAAIRADAPRRICTLLQDPVPEVRASAVYALGTFTGGAEGSEQRSDLELDLALTLTVVTADCSTMVRRELVFALAHFVEQYEERFKQIAQAEDNRYSRLVKMEELRNLKKGKSKKNVMSESPTAESSIPDPVGEQDSIFSCIWKVLVGLCGDPHPDVASLSLAIVKRLLPPNNPLAMSIEDHSVASPRKAVSGPTNIPSPTKKQRPALGKSNVTPLNISQQDSRRPSDVSSAKSQGQDEKEESQSVFYEWSCLHFGRPIMTPTPRTDPSSPQNISKAYRHARNHYTVQEAHDLARRLDTSKAKMKDQLAIIQNGSKMTNSVVFHRFEPLLIVADGADNISVWNWEDPDSKLNCFSNLSSTSSRLTSVQLFNENDEAALFAASDDGVIRVWKGVESSDSLQLVSSWRALPDDNMSTVANSNNRGRVVIDWRQESGTLVVSGNTSNIRLWDVQSELLMHDFPTESKSSVSCMTSQANILTAGFGDGTVRVYDKRMKSCYSCVSTLSEHRNYVVNVSMPSFMDGMIVSGSVTGEVKFWKIGMSQSISESSSSHNTLAATSDALTTALAVHNYAPVLALGSQNQKINVVDFNGQSMGSILFYDDFLGQRISPVSCLAFHPCKMVLAAGATDSLISLHSVKSG